MLWAMETSVALSLTTLSFPQSAPASLVFLMFLRQHCIMIFFKHKVKLKDFYGEYSYTYHLDATINVLLY